MCWFIGLAGWFAPEIGIIPVHDFGSCAFSDPGATKFVLVSVFDCGSLEDPNADLHSPRSEVAYAGGNTHSAYRLVPGSGFGIFGKIMT